MKLRLVRNEKGLTLIEVLAAVTITAFLIGVATMMFSSIQLSWNTETSKYEDNAEIRMVMNTLTRYVTDTPRAYVRANELRVAGYGEDPNDRNKTIPVAWAFVRDGLTNKLTMYDFSTSVQLNDSVAVTNTSVYTKPIQLSDQVTEFYFKDSAGGTLGSASLSGGSLLKVNVTFRTTTTKVTGKSTGTTSRTATFKLFSY